jgi:hypothetical protein
MADDSVQDDLAAQKVQGVLDANSNDDPFTTRHVSGVLARNAGIVLNPNTPHSDTNVPENLELGRKHGIS